MTLYPRQAWLIPLLIIVLLLKLLRLGRQYVRQYYQLPPSFYGRYDTS